MFLTCETRVGDRFQSRSQQARVITEKWFGLYGYCLSCTSPRLEAEAPNRAAHDFTCPSCSQSYELKSCEKMPTRRIVDGAYTTMMQRIHSSRPPLLVLLQYSREQSQLQEQWYVKRLVGVHPVFLTASTIESRKPLSANARRAGWQGCTIRIDLVPPEGLISLVHDGVVVEPSVARALFDRSRQFATVDPALRGWAVLVLKVIRDIQLPTIRLAQLYEHKHIFESAFPNNRNIEAKVRQQVQILRDMEFLRFEGRGEYRVMK